MQLEIEGSSLVHRPAVRRHIDMEISDRLSRFADRIGTVRIRLRERRPSEPTRTLCGIGVTLDPHEGGPDAWLLARAEDDDPYRAIDRAVERVAAAVGEQIARRDRDRRAHALVAFAHTGVVERV